MANPWTFVDRYPALKLSLFESLRFSRHDFREAPDGLFFDGTLLLDGPLAALSRFFGGNGAVDVSGGPIEVIGQGAEAMPKMALRADTIGRVELGSFRLDIKLAIDNDVVINPKGKPRAGPALTLLAEIPVSGHAPLQITAPMGANMGHTIFSATVPPDLELGLPLLSRLADNTPLAGLLPAQLPIISDFILTGWSLGVVPAVPRLTSVSVAVETRKGISWEIVPGLIAIESIGFVFNVAFLAAGRELNVEMTGRIRLSKDPDVFLDLGATYPGFVVSGSFDGGPPPVDLTNQVPGFRLEPSPDDCTLDLRALAIKFLGEPAGNALPTILKVCTLTFELDPKAVAFSLDAFLETEWTIIEVSAKPLITLTGIQMMFRHVARATSGTITASFRLADPATGPEIAVSAGFNSADGGWSFRGELAGAGGLSLRQLVEFYMPGAHLPPGDVKLSKLSASVETGLSKAYAFEIAASWEDIFGGSLPLKSLGAAVSVDSRLENGVRRTKGRISGRLDFGGVVLMGGFSFDSGADNVIDLTLFDITATLNTKNPPFVLRIKPKGRTLGDIVSLLVRAATGGGQAELPAPWNVLNLVSLDGFEFVVDFTNRKVGFEYQLDLNFGFVRLKKISLAYNLDTKEVLFEIVDGSFLGGAVPLPPAWDVTDPNKAPAVPGQGSDLLNVKFLAAGQHVVPTDDELPPSVARALDILQAAFKVPARIPPLQQTALRFDNTAGWLIGARMVVIGIIEIDAVFYDPLLYGVAIRVTGGNFKGLGLEVLYKKVSDTVGVYQIDLTLPDFIRNQDFGAFSVTLPSLKLSIFTNGNFIIDLGFPAGGDFTRSFSLQWLPFVGSGGFYYGQLSGETAKGLPETVCGDFNPAIAFGIGVRVGIGKEINKGILKAGLSLTVQGILEGLFAVFHPYPGRNLLTGGVNALAPVASGGDTATYYFVQGQIALVGRIYGEVNFAILSAELDITARIAVRLVLEAARRILIEFEASVSVSLKVSVNLGLFKIRISLSFKATVRADFTIGQDDPLPPWRRCGMLPQAGRRRLTTPLDALDGPCGIVPELSWVPIEPEEPVDLQLFYLPQFTVAGTDGGRPAGRGVAVLFVEAAETSGLAPGEVPEARSFERLAEGVFLWTMNAFFELPDPKVAHILAHEVTAEELQQILCALTRTDLDGVPRQPFQSEDIVEFLAGYVAATIDIPPPGSAADPERTVGLFPILPFFTLTIDGGDARDFAQFNRVTDGYLAQVKRYFRELFARFQRESHQDAPNVLEEPMPEQSLAELLFVDYFAMLARALTEDARDLFGVTTVAARKDHSLADLAATNAHHGLSAAELGFLNRRRPLAAGAPLKVRQLTHMAAAGDTLLAVANRFGVPVRRLIADNQDVKGLFDDGRRLIVRGALAMTVGEILARLKAAHRLQHLSGLAARVYLAGLRPPAPPAARPGPPSPLYTLSGQQFDASKLGLGAALTLALTSGTPLPWLTLGPDFGPPPGAPVPLEPRTAITFHLTQEIVDLVSRLEGAASAFAPASAFETLALFDVQQRRSTLRNPIVWKKPDAGLADPGIWAFPPDLLRLTREERALDPRFLLVREVDGHEQLLEPGWVSLLPLTVRLTPSAQPGAAPLPNVYEMQGTDEAGSQLLEQLLIRADADRTLTATVQVLYPEEPVAEGNQAPPVGLRSDGLENTSVFLLQTNLSTVSNPTALAGLRALAGGPSNLVGMTGVELLRLVWEGSVVRSGGYFLYYRVSASGAGLPSFLFNEDNTTTVYLLVEYNLAHEVTGDPLPPFLNAVTTAAGVDPQDELLFVRTVNQTVARHTMAAEETLADLSRRFRTDPGALALANRYRRLRPGVRVQVPAASVLEQNGVAWRAGFVYEAGQEDTFAALAHFRGVSLTALGHANALVPGLFAEPLTFDDRLQVKVGSIPAGNVGLALERANPDRLGDPVAREVEELYNLLEYRIAPFGVFKESKPALPVGPTKQEPSSPFDPDADTRPPQALVGDPWRYEGVLPVFLRPTLAMATGAPGPADDPYATVGQSVRVRFTWLDMFGNSLAAVGGPAGWPDHDLSIRYVDDVVGLDSWPNLIARYRIRPTPGPTLALDMAFVRDRYRQGAAADPVRQALSDRDVYRTVYYQLQRADVTVAVGTTLERDTLAAATDPKPPLLGFVGAILDFLTGVVDNGPPRNPIPPLTLDLSSGVTDSNPKNVFSLEVTLEIRRDPALVDDQFRDVPAVARARAVVAPDIEGPSTATVDGAPISPLRLFATRIEEAFPQLRVLTGSRQADEDPGLAVDLWLARFGATPQPGIVLDIQADRPFFFTPRPLAVSLLSRPDQDHAEPVPVYPYVSGEFIGDQIPVPQTVTGVDMESLARDCLEAIDQFLAADFSVPAWKLENAAPAGRVAPGGRVTSEPGQPDPLTQPFQAIIDAKERIARAISDGVAAVLTTPVPDPTNLLEAREQWRQQLLVQLANAYRIETAVQYGVAVTAQAPPLGRRPPRLFGKVVSPPEATTLAADPTHAFSFNASRIPLSTAPGSAFLTFMLEVRQARAQRNLRTPLDLQLTQLERDIRPVPAIAGFEASSWLSFVNPFLVSGPAGAALLDPVIPIPLRAYPTPPSLTAQRAIPEAPQFAGGTARGRLLARNADDLDKARAWRYLFAYEGVEADQDTVHAVVTLNVRRSTATVMADADAPDLFEALVQLAAVYAAVAQDLSEALRAGDPGPVARGALTSFAWLVQRVANAWPAWLESRESLLAARVEPDRESAFSIHTEGQGQDPLVIAVARTRAVGEPIALPEVEIEGYRARREDLPGGARFTYTSDATGLPLSAAAGRAIPRRQVVFPGFDVLEQENAWAGVFVVRNEDLVPGQETRRDFLYQTPLVRFVDVLTPLLDPDVEIDIAGFTPMAPPQPLLTYLANFFTAFFQGAVAAGQARTVKMGGSYAYALDTTPAGAARTTVERPDLHIELPIFLTTPQPFPVGADLAGNPFLLAVTAKVDAWLVHNHPAGLELDGRLVLDLSVFASLSDSKLPVLRLRRLVLPTRLVKLRAS